MSYVRFSKNADYESMNLINVVIDLLLIVGGILVGYIFRPFIIAFYSRKGENKADKQDAIKLTMLKQVAEEKINILKTVKQNLGNMQKKSASIMESRYKESHEGQKAKGEKYSSYKMALEEFTDLISSNTGLFPEFFKTDGMKICNIINNQLIIYRFHNPNQTSNPDYKEEWEKIRTYHNELMNAISQFRFKIDQYKQSPD